MGRGSVARTVKSFLPFVPPTATHNDLEAYTFKRNGKTKAGIRKGERLKEAEEMMWPYVQRMAKSSLGVPLRPPVEQTVKICWPTEGKHEQGEPRIEPPDYDNWVKTFNDLCERAGIIANDSHIVSAHVYKLYADPAGVSVSFRELLR